MTSTLSNPRLSAALDEYLAQRRARGYLLVEAERHLHRFIEWLWERGNHSDCFTTEEVLHWVHGNGTLRVTYQAQKLGTLRGFSAYCQGLGIDAALVSPRCLPPSRSRATPHIYTQTEVDALLEACPKVFHRHPFVAETMTTMIRLLCATGMRVSEALKIETGDIDTNSGTLLVKASKGGPHHLIPLPASATGALHSFAHSPERTRLHLRVGELLFISMRRKPHQPLGIQSNFARLRADCGIEWEGRLPRLHDFRHTFATRQMIRAYTAEGSSPANTLALVSNWLGHSDPSHTYWYIQNIPELLALAAGRRDTPNRTENQS